MAYQKKLPSEYKKPPPRSIEINPLHGNSTTSKIDFYQLGDIVKSMRECGCTLDEIQTEINTKYLTEENQFVSKMSLSRWINKNIDNAKELDQRSNRDISINEYQELKEMIEYCDSQLEISELALHGLKEDSKKKKVPIRPGDITNIMNANEKTLARKQALLASITQIKEKMISWQTTFDIVNIILGKVKEKDLVLFAEIVGEIKTDPLLNQAFQSMKTKKRS